MSDRLSDHDLAALEGLYRATYPDVRSHKLWEADLILNAEKVLSALTELRERRKAEKARPE